MLTALVILSSIVVFIVALFSPPWGTKIQRKSRSLLEGTQRFSQTKPKVIRWLIDFSSGLSHKLVHGSATGGKKSRWKLPF